MKKNLSRREFIQGSSKAALVFSAAGLATSCSFLGGKNEKYKIPRRKLGKTGMDVSILSFGASSQFLQLNDGDWEKALEAAVEGGINLIDTAPSYYASKFWQTGDGKSLDSSEERIGRILPPCRDRIFLSTKIETRDPDKVQEEVEGSLTRMKTDHVDILMIHGITESDKIAETENGIYKKMIRLKESGMVKFIGFTSMEHAPHAAKMLESLDFDVVLLTLNATKYGDFAELVLPVARKKNTGVLAMKVMRDIVGKEATPEELLHYVWSQDGVAAAMIGHNSHEALADNIRLAQEYGETGFVAINREALENRLAGFAGPHALCWAKPGYYDGAATVRGASDFFA